MYWEESGNPHGAPVLFLHGGPGAGATAVHRRFFDPAYWRIVIFDQRGAGRSTPVGELHDNTPDHLVGDIELLRRELGVAEWLVFGGSWGSTLALHYAETHTDRVAGLILRGIFLCRPAEIDWFLHGARVIFPEAWRAFTGFLPQHERDDLLAAYYRRLTDPDPRIHMPAARAWSAYEGACSTCCPTRRRLPPRQDRLALGRRGLRRIISAGTCFRRSATDRADRSHSSRAQYRAGPLRQVRLIRSADELARAWPKAEYIIVPDAGHSRWNRGSASSWLAGERHKRR